MCGRYELHTHPAVLALLYGVPFPEDMKARYNVTPSQELPVVRIDRDGKRELAAKIHNRMPVILAPEDYARWLDVEAPDAAELLKPYPADEMRAYPVSTRVNKPANDDAGLIEEVQPPETAAGTPSGVDED